MTQYCRYCTACHVANGNWCEIKQKTLTDAQIKHSNKCRDFEFCSMDVYDENRTYQPRQKKQKPLAVMLGEQMMMNFGKG